MNWTAIPGATGYKIYRGDTSGGELLLATVGAVTTYVDDTNATPAGAMPTSDPTNGVGVGIARQRRVRHDAGVPRRPSDHHGRQQCRRSHRRFRSSTFGAESTSGAGGSNVGFAGSLAANIVVIRTSAIDRPAQQSSR